MYRDLNYPLERGQEALIRDVMPWWLPFSQVSSFFVSHTNKMQCGSVQSPTNNRKSSKYIFKGALNSYYLTTVIPIPGGIFGTPVGLDPDFRSQRTRTLGLARDPPESQFQIVNTDNVD